jgi:RNA polymerase sigma factor (sigma-70 family)
MSVDNLTSTSPDELLIETLLDPDSTDEAKTAASESLVCRYLETMSAWAEQELHNLHCHCLNALDVVHQVVAGLMDGQVLRRFNRRLPLEPWLHRVVSNKARDLARQERRHQACRLEGQAVACPQRSPVAICIMHEEYSAVLAQLSDEEQAVCCDFYQEGLSARDVAEQHGKTVDEVYRQLYQVRARLRRRFGGQAFSP